ncbi:MAG: hypothetical protein R3300_15535 [Candidatus Promineifilaceae bacterium]|nr:hypothetical protein [Candidatus Promineifilaceae bacterium]
MTQAQHRHDWRYQVLAIPLKRPQIVEFLQGGPGQKRGAEVQIVAQRPTHPAEAAWATQLARSEQLRIEDLLTLDHPRSHLVKTTTDRLIPVEKLQDPEYLTLNLGGWAPIYFATVGRRPETGSDDPMLRQAEVLGDYGPTIRYTGADPKQVRQRLGDETAGETVATTAAALIRLEQLRQEFHGAGFAAFAERLYREIVMETCFATVDHPPLPPVVLLDALLSEMVRIELARRHAVAANEDARAAMIQAWQQDQQAQSGLLLILKAEYVVGRARRSTVLLAPELGLVIKQPGPEPFHEIRLGARIYEGTEENWPYLTHDGSLVTPRARARLIVEEDLLPRITRVFGHQMRFCTLFGVTLEEHVRGQTVQQMVLADPERMTPKLYDEFVLRQQVCEQLGIENGDWHSANFMVRQRDGQLVHIDWGAARPLEPAELTPAGRVARLNQMRNIAFSFHNQRLAERILYLHAELIGNPERLAAIRQRADSMIAQQLGQPGF